MTDNEFKDTLKRLCKNGNIKLKVRRQYYDDADSEYELQLVIDKEVVLAETFN